MGHPDQSADPTGSGQAETRHAPELIRLQAVLRAARGAERNLISDVRLFDVYEGAPLEAGQRSLGVEVVLQPKLASLTDAEIEAVGEKIVGAVTRATGANLRR